jgi:phage terminase large subunit
MFIRTTAINKLLKLKKFIKGVQGGSSAGKTFGIIPIEIDYAIKNPNTEISIVAESIPHLKRGAIRDFKKIMSFTNRWNDNNWNASDFRYTFTNGSFVEFFSAENSSKLRGARRDRLYINECNNIDFNSFTELAMRTKQSIFLDWNPSNEFWFHNELLNEDNVDFIILNYKDNEAAPESAIEFIEKAKEKAKTSDFWDNWYKVYGLGQIGSLQGVVFNNWKTIDTIPSEARLIGIGVDFGYTNDPTTIIEVYNYNGQRIVNELVYQQGLVNSDIAKHLPNNVPIYADSSEPKSIEEIRRFGKLISGVTKGQDSINFGIQIMQSQNYLVTSNSTNLIKELRSYCWATDKTGIKLNKPIDNFNHAIDALRYHEMETLGLKNNREKYHIW